MRPGVVVPPDIARRQRRVEGRLRRRDAEIFFPEQTVDRSGGDGREILADRIGPLIGRAAGQEHGARRAERDEHVRVDGHLVPAARPLLERRGEPPRKVLRHVVDGLPPIAAREGRSHFSGTAREHGRDARIVRGRPERGLAQT